MPAKPQRFATVSYVISGGVARVELCRPEKRNALNAMMLRELLVAFNRAREDPAVRVVVLSGAGDRVFCAGGDLDEMGDVAADEPLATLSMLVEAITGLGKPVMCRLNGHALAGGLGVACCCDIVIAADDVLVGTP